MVEAERQGVDRSGPDQPQGREASPVDVGLHFRPFPLDGATGQAAGRSPTAGGAGHQDPVSERADRQVEAGEQPSYDEPEQRGSSRRREAVGRRRDPRLEQVPRGEHHAAAEPVRRASDGDPRGSQAQPEDRSGREVVGEVQCVCTREESMHGHAAHRCRRSSGISEARCRIERSGPTVPGYPS